MHRLSLKGKFALLIGLIFALLLSAIGTSLYSLNSLSTTLAEVDQRISPIRLAIGEVTKAQLTQSIELERALRALQDFNKVENVVLYSESFNHFSILNEEIHRQISQAMEIAQQGKAKASRKVDSQEFAKLLAQLESLQKSHQLYEGEVDKLFEILSQGRTDKAALQQLTNRANQLNQSVSQLLDSADHFSSTILQQANALETKAERLVWGMAGVGVVIGLLLSWWMLTTILRQIGGEPEEIAALAELVAKGQLNLDLSHYQETTGIHHSTLKMALDLSGVIRNVIHNAQEVEAGSHKLAETSSKMATKSHAVQEQTSTIASASEEITINVNHVADEANRTAGMISSVSAGVEELSVSINTIAAATEEASANMGEVAQNMGQISDQTTKVKQAVDSLSHSMIEINQNAQSAQREAEQAGVSAEEALEIMNNLADAANRIGRIVKMISNIANQTNMLSLNATIEATNAGSAGKGFAVVAKEVKQLAQESAEANSEVAEAIHQVQNKISNALDRTQDVNSVMRKMVETFAAISKEIAMQNQRTQEIAQSVDFINQSSQHAVRNVEEATLGVKEITRSIAQASSAAKDSAQNSQAGSNSVRAIARSAKELSLGIEEINTSMKTIQLNADDLNHEMGHSKEVALDLKKQAEALEKMVSYFQLN